MKKLFCILLALLLLASCTTSETPESATEFSSVEAPTTAPTEESTFHEWYDPEFGGYSIDSSTYTDFLANESLHPEGFVDFETLNAFDFEFESLWASSWRFEYLCSWRNERLYLLLVSKNLNIKETDFVALEEMGDSLYEMPEKYFSKDQKDRYVKIGNATYEYCSVALTNIYFMVNDCLIQVMFLDENEALWLEHPVMKNLLDPSTAPAQIDELIAQWAGKWQSFNN